jgi:ketosteroid isomerase-like protein
MGARGPHDDVDSAKAVVDAALRAMNEGDVATGRALIDDDLEHVTRDGVVHGPGRLFEEFGTQLERWQIAYELEELIDAGEGALIAIVKVERRNRESGEVEWKAWPALVVRILNGKVIFFEGYVDRRKAIEDLGVAVEQ